MATKTLACGCVTAALALGALLQGCCACCGDKGDSGAAAAAAPAARVARATIEGRSGSPLTGAAVFTEAAGEVQVAITVAGAPPGLHAVHLHDKGDCSAPDATSAGSHFNPDQLPHGALGAEKSHAGDFGNMDVAADGTGKLVLKTKRLTVAPGTHSVDGRAIIIHAQPDDFSQPAGNAGARLGCGVIHAQ
jgi:Cu-Zn family superoxide dismutase